MLISRKISETKRVASKIAAHEPSINVLVNNAGAIFNACQITDDNFERTFALDRMAYFVLTRCLLDRLTASTPSRIVNTASDAYEGGVLNFNDLQSSRAYRGNLLEALRYGGPGYKVYATSKLCNVLFTRELAKRMKGTGVTVNCLHPGFVATRFADSAGGLMSVSMRIAKHFAKPAHKGSETLDSWRQRLQYPRSVESTFRIAVLFSLKVQHAMIPQRNVFGLRAAGLLVWSNRGGRGTRFHLLQQIYRQRPRPELS